MQYNSVIMAISKFYKTMMLIYMWGFFFYKWKTFQLGIIDKKHSSNFDAYA